MNSRNLEFMKHWAMSATQRSPEAVENLRGESTWMYSTSMTAFYLHMWNVPVIKPFHGLYHVLFGFCFGLGSCISYIFASASLLSQLPHASGKYG